jgi:hypothetical protein
MTDKVALIMMRTIEPIALTHWEYEQVKKELESRAIADCPSIGDKILAKILLENYSRYHEAKKRNDSLPIYRGKGLPKPGDIIYVNTSWSIDHGETDVAGGKACVREVKATKNHNIGWVTVWEHPGHSYGWLCLMNDQTKLEEQFGDKWAYPDPDYG